MKFKLRVHHFDTVEKIQSSSQMVLDMLKEWYFQGASQAWQEHLERCITAQGDYPEGEVCFLLFIGAVLELFDRTSI